MPLSGFPPVVTVSASGALTGDGSSASPLAVAVDGVTVQIVSNQLVSVGTGDVTGPASAVANTLALYNGTTGKIIAAGLTDPNADRLVFWDDSAGSTAYLALGTGLSITDTTINAAGLLNGFASIPVAGQTTIAASGATALTVAAGSNITLTTDNTTKTLTIAASSGGGTISIAVDIAPEDIATAFSSPVEIIASPGAGKFIYIKKFFGAVTGTIPFNVIHLTPYFETSEAKAIDDDNDDNYINLVDDTIGKVGQNSTFAVPPLQALIADIEDNAVVIKGDADDPSGAINAVSLDDGGLGYAVNDTFSVDTGGTSGIGTVDTVDGFGTVLTFHISTAGYGYVPISAGATNALTGIGTGLTIDIDSITPANTPVRLYIDYEILDLP